MQLLTEILFIVTFCVIILLNDKLKYVLTKKQNSSYLVETQHLSYTVLIALHLSILNGTAECLPMSDLLWFSILLSPIIFVCLAILILSPSLSVLKNVASLTYCNLILDQCQDPAFQSISLFFGGVFFLQMVLKVSLCVIYEHVRSLLPQEELAI